MNGSKSSNYSRRNFIKNSSLVSLGFSILPRHVLGKGYLAPSDCLNVAIIGYGGRGQENLTYALSNKSCQIVAVCDPNLNMLELAKINYPSIQCFSSLHELPNSVSRDIDAILISSPDYTHTSLTQSAIEMNKHILCEAPLAKSYAEFNELITNVNQQTKIVQSGFFGIASEYEQIIKKLVNNGELGNVHTIHLWNSQYQDTPTWHNKANIGMGELGINGFNMFQLPISLLNLQKASKVSGSIGDVWNYKTDYKIDELEYPIYSYLKFNFEEREGFSPLDIYWYEGGIKPKRPREIPNGIQFGDTVGGMLWEGTKASLLCDSFGKPLVFFNKSFCHDFKNVNGRREIDHKLHIEQWIQSCKLGHHKNSKFAYTEVKNVATIVLQGDKFIMTRNDTIA